MAKEKAKEVEEEEEEEQEETVGVLLRDSLLYVSNYKREIGEYRE